MVSRSGSSNKLLFTVLLLTLHRRGEYFHLTNHNLGSHPLNAKEGYTMDKRTLENGGYGMGTPFTRFPGLSVFFNNDDGAGGGEGGEGNDPPKDPPEKNEPEEKVPYSRFKQVNDKAKAAEKELADMKAAKAKEDEEKLKSDKDYQKLAETKAEEAKAAKADLEKATIKVKSVVADNALVVAAYKAGATDEQLPFILRAVEREGIEVDDELKVSGADKAIEALKKAMPAMFSEPSNGSPGPGGKPPKKGSQTPEEAAKAIREQRHPKTTPNADKPDYWG